MVIFMKRKDEKDGFITFTTISRDVEKENRTIYILKGTLLAEYEILTLKGRKR